MKEKHVILLSGFTQNEGRFNGVTDLSLKLRSQASTSVWVHTPPYIWTRREESISSFLQQAGAREVFIIGYSWGGNKAIQLAETLSERGIKVPYMVLCDPVRRPAGPALLGKFQLIRDLLAFNLPENVGLCHVFLQKTNWPSGFPVKGTFLTEVETTKIENVTHELMDNLPEFHLKALKFLHLFEKRP